MAKFNRSIIILFLSITLSGCIYLPKQYYKPSGTGDFNTGWGDYLKSQCAGPDNHVAIEIEDGLALSVRAQMVQNQDNSKAKLDSVLLILYLGPGHRLQFKTPLVELISSADQQKIQKTITEFYFKRAYIIEGDPKDEIDFEFPIKGDFSDSVKTHSISNGKTVAWVKYFFSPIEEIQGGSIPSTDYNSLQRLMLSTWQLHRGYIASIDVKDINLDTFYLNFPITLFDGQPKRFPKIKIDLVDEWVRYALLC